VFSRIFDNYNVAPFKCNDWTGEVSEEIILMAIISSSKETPHIWIMYGKGMLKPVFSQKNCLR